MIKQDSLEEIVGNKYAKVVVGGERSSIEVTPDPVTVYWLDATKEDSIRWEFNTPLPGGAKSVVIKWDVESPFQNFGAECDNGRLVLIATGNTGIGGLFRYSILFLDEKGQVVAGVDPGVHNDPVHP